MSGCWCSRTTSAFSSYGEAGSPRSFSPRPMVPECIDIRGTIEEAVPRSDGEDRLQRQARLHLACTNIVTALWDWVASAPDEAEPVLIDRQRRAPYKRYRTLRRP